MQIAGADEAGRGPLVGSVVAAAVILDPNNPIQGLNDSKKLTGLCMGSSSEMKVSVRWIPSIF